MKLEYAIVGGAANYVTIYDEAAIAQPSQFDAKAIGVLASPEWHPYFKSLVQSEDTFTLPNQSKDTGKFRQSLDNVVSTVRGKFHVPYATRADAANSILTWKTLLQRHVVFKFTQDTAVMYYPDATVTDLDCDLNGVMVVHTFAFESDIVTSVAPQ